METFSFVYLHDPYVCVHYRYPMKYLTHICLVLIRVTVVTYLPSVSPDVLDQTKNRSK